MVTNSSGEQNDRGTRNFVCPSHADVDACLPEPQRYCRGQNIIPGIPQFFPFECSTALWSGKEQLTRRAFGQSQSKMTAVSGNVYQSKPD